MFALQLLATLYWWRWHCCVEGTALEVLEVCSKPLLCRPNIFHRIMVLQSLWKWWTVGSDPPSLPTIPPPTYFAIVCLESAHNLPSFVSVGEVMFFWCRRREKGYYTLSLRTLLHHEQPVVRNSPLALLHPTFDFSWFVVISLSLFVYQTLREDLVVSVEESPANISPSSLCLSESPVLIYISMLLLQGMLVIWKEYMGFGISPYTEVQIPSHRKVIWFISPLEKQWYI